MFWQEFKKKVNEPSVLSNFVKLNQISFEHRNINISLNLSDKLIKIILESSSKENI